MKPNGKNICAALKEVRQRIADTNGIVYRPKECHFEGDCDGTCPACEAEVRYLEQQISLLQRAGKAVTVMGVALGMAMTAGCKQANAAPATPQSPMADKTQRMETARNAMTNSEIVCADTTLTDSTRREDTRIFEIGEVPYYEKVDTVNATVNKPIPNGKIAPPKKKVQKKQTLKSRKRLKARKKH